MVAERRQTSLLPSLSLRVCFALSLSVYLSMTLSLVPAGSPSRAGDIMVYVLHKPTELATAFYSVLVSLSVFMVLSTVFHSVNSPDNLLLSHSVLPVLFLPYWSFQLFICL